ncbi:hypothetical protein ACJMK2_009450 [Sinanodonta woodiana]|uniref:Uncharacterized protein n=1 Tax=Sinanodonta woodiana TaxID=1069815 RepID=A0ABD3VCA6_SINWO
MLLNLFFFLSSDYGDEGNVIKTLKQTRKDDNILFSEAVDKVSVYGFTTAYVNMDGAQSNRSIMHMHGIKPSLSNLNVTSPVNPDQSNSLWITHVIKTIRNNIMKNKNNIQWQMWVADFNRDKTRPLQIHKALTQAQVYPNAMEKMIHHLAEEVLHNDLMTEVNIHVKAYIQMIRNFHDQRPIFHANDMRLHEKMEILDCDVTSTGKSKKLLSQQCIEDLYVCMLGFDQLSQINSDVENEFCQQRTTYNRPNPYLNALQYRRNLTKIILGQSSLSRKHNAVTKLANATSYAFNNPQPLRNFFLEKASIH